MTQAQLKPVLRHIRRLVGADAVQELSDAELLERFVSAREETAFAALLRRHSRLVWSVCWNVLHHQQDAEDAFQATFLLLARQARSIRQTDAVGSWLYRVAYRVATKAGMAMAKRRIRERGVEREPRLLQPCHTVSRPEGEAAWRELQAVLHEELNLLPDKYRAPFVLCCLEGKSGPAAARQLGWKLGTVSGRLTEARKLLERRLARRGVLLSSILCGTALACEVSAQVPPALVNATVKAALGVVAGKAVAGLVSVRVAALVEAGLRTMIASKLKVGTAVLLAASVLAGASILTHQALAEKAADPSSPTAKLAQKSARPPAAKEDAKPQGAKESATVVDNDKDSIAYSGRVLGPDGKPVAGAKLYLTSAYHYLWRPSPSPQRATTGPDGRFQFTAPKAKYGDHRTVVTAAAADYGAGWVMAPTYGKKDDLTIHLVKDDVPITGQIVDLEGKPIPGVTLTVLQISAAAGEDLSPWLEAVKRKKERSFDLERRYLKRDTTAISQKATTDADGRFRLTGIGRNRLVRAQLEGRGVANQDLHILTRPGKTIEALEYEGRPEYNDPRRVTIYYGASFRHVAVPARPIDGVVRDKDTKKPLPGVSIRSLKLANNPIHLMDGQEIVLTTTDAEGRYRLMGMPKGDGNKIKLVPPADLLYVGTSADVPNSPGLEPVTMDFELKRGVWIEGKITDKVTGKPLQGGVGYLGVEYFPLYPNPNLDDYPGFFGAGFHRGTVKEDGSYRVVGLPGPGMVGVYYQRDYYLRAPERDDEYGIKETSDLSLEFGVKQSTGLRLPFPFYSASGYGALARINPTKGLDSVKEITLDPGGTFTGTVLGPDSKPLAGTRAFDLTRHWWDNEGMEKAEFTAWFNPRHPPREILFLHPEKRLIGVAQSPKEKGGSITVRMEPGATVTGRLVGADGQPRAGVELELTFLPKGWGNWTEYLSERVQTDREGRFRLESLLPGREFRLSDDTSKVLVVRTPRSGQTNDLGDVQLKPNESRRERR